MGKTSSCPHTALAATLPLLQLPFPHTYPLQLPHTPLLPSLPAPLSILFMIQHLSVQEGVQVVTHKAPELTGSPSIEETHQELGVFHTLVCVSVTWVIGSERKSIIICQDEHGEDGGKEGMQWVMLREASGQR